MKPTSLLFILFLTATFTAGNGNENPTLSHKNNWAVLVCTSSYFFNYRHLANTLSMYYIIRKMGIPDSHIILMSSIDSLCDSRNPYPGQMFNTITKDVVLNTLQGNGINDDKRTFDGVEYDYRGDEVSVDSFMRLLTGRHKKGTPTNKILQSKNDSNILIFLSGHGGDEFMKFRDVEEMSSQDLGFAFKEMELKGRYREILFIIDTCQASTLAASITSPRITTIGSSAKGENSYAYETDKNLGVAVIDRFSHAVSSFFSTQTGITIGNNKNILKNEKKTLKKKRLNVLSLQDLIDSLDPTFLFSTPTVIQSKETRHPKDIPIKDFFSQSKTDINLLEVSLFDNIVNGDIYDKKNAGIDNNQNLNMITTDRKWKSDINDKINSFYLSSETIDDEYEYECEYDEECIEASLGYTNHQKDEKNTIISYPESSNPIYILINVLLIISFMCFLFETIL